VKKQALECDKCKMHQLIVVNTLRLTDILQLVKRPSLWVSTKKATPIRCGFLEKTKI